MTTVVALARNGAVFMAADSCNNVYDRPILGGATKIARLRVGKTGAEALIGFCGDGALSRLVPRLVRLKRSAPDTNDERDVNGWAQAIAEAVTDVAVQYHCLDNSKLDASLPLGYGGRLWTLVNNQAIYHPDGIAAVGSGEGPAIGAVDAYLNPFDRDRSIDGSLIVRRAVEIACHRDRYSRPPIQVEILEPVAS